MVPRTISNVDDKSVPIFMTLLFSPPAHGPVITGHQAFFTRNALEQIALTTIANISEFEARGQCEHQLPAK